MYATRPEGAALGQRHHYGFGPQSVGGWERTRTYAEVLQDWKGWLDEGIIDTTVAMNYKRESLPEQQQMFREWNEVLADWQAGRQNASVPRSTSTPSPRAARQARVALEPSAAGNRVAGWSGYSYAVPSAAANADPALADTERAALTAALTTADPNGAAPLFARKAKVPTMAWKARPSSGHVVGALVRRSGPTRTPLDQVPVTLTNLRTGETTAAGLSDGSGWFAFVDVAPGRWKVTADPPDDVRGSPVAVVHVAKGRIASARFSLR